MALLYIFILSSLVYWSTQQVGIGQLDVVSDLVPENCFAAGTNYKEANGLPGCVTSFSGAGPCAIIFNPTSVTTKDMVYKPTSCAKDGKYGSKQCKGERTTGRCFCFSEAGERLFGQAWWSEAANMTCACSRKKAEMAASPDDDFYFNSIHCNSMGNYEPMQCDVVSGQCWCADEMTGDLISPIVPDKAMNKLPCYSAGTVGSQYLRQCESKKHAQNRIIHELKRHGTTADYEEYLCDDDGSYGAYTLIDGSAYCTWRDNSKLGSYQSGQDHTGVNCYCAKDVKIFSDHGTDQPLKCGPSGNYEKLQKSDDTPYCVDIDGYRKSPKTAKVINETSCQNFRAYHDFTT